MIDVTSEQLLTLTQAAALLPGHPSIATLWAGEPEEHVVDGWRAWFWAEKSTPARRRSRGLPCSAAAPANSGSVRPTNANGQSPGLSVSCGTREFDLGGAVLAADTSETKHVRSNQSSTPTSTAANPAASVGGRHVIRIPSAAPGLKQGRR